MKIIDNKDRREQFFEEKQKKGVELTNRLNNGELVDKNSDILTIIYGELCNPNGDPNMDDDIRYDFATGKLLITRACLHNLLRKELASFYLKLFYSRVYNEKFYQKHERLPTCNERVNTKINDDVLDFQNGQEDFFTCIDRGLGALITNKKDKSNEKYAAVSYDTTISLNKVERLAEEKVNAPFSSTNENKKQTSFGKTNRVHYFISAVKGGVSKDICEEYLVTKDIIRMYDYCFINSFFNIKSYKKSGMKCPFYIRVEYLENKEKKFIGNLNDYIEGKPKAGKVLCMDDFEVDMSGLVKVLKENRDIINRIYYHEDSITRKIFGGVMFKELLQDAGLAELLVPIERPF